MSSEGQIMLGRAEGAPSEEPAPAGVPGAVHTEWIQIEYVYPTPGFEPDFPAPRSIAMMAAEQKQFLASIEEPLVDIELPADG